MLCECSLYSSIRMFNNVTENVPEIFIIWNKIHIILNGSWYTSSYMGYNTYHSNTALCMSCQSGSDTCHPKRVQISDRLERLWSCNSQIVTHKGPNKTCKYTLSFREKSAKYYDNYSSFWRSNNQVYY